MNPNAKRLTAVATIIPAWFAVAAALTYACGFLCVYTFMERFGLGENARDIITAKYLHAGILVFLFPVGIVLPVWAVAVLWSLRAKYSIGNTATPDPAIYTVHPTSILLFMNMLTVFYVCILFMPVNFLRTHQGLLFAIVASGLVAPALIKYIAKEWIKDTKARRFADHARWFLAFIVLVVLDCYAFLAHAKRLWHLFYGTGFIPGGASYHYFFMCLIAFVCWRIQLVSATLVSFRERLFIWVACAAICFVLLFLATISFAITIYPVVPAGKGGGDFSQSRCVTVRLAPTPTNMTAQPLDPGLFALTTSNCFVIVEQTANSIYFANTNDAGGPTKWREGTNYPTLLEVRRASIDSIIHK